MKLLSYRIARYSMKELIQMTSYKEVWEIVTFLVFWVHWQNFLTELENSLFAILWMKITYSGWELQKMVSHNLLFLMINFHAKTIELPSLQLMIMNFGFCYLKKLGQSFMEIIAESSVVFVTRLLEIWQVLLDICICLKTKQIYGKKLKLLIKRINYLQLVFQVKMLSNLKN